MRNLYLRRQSRTVRSGVRFNKNTVYRTVTALGVRSGTVQAHFPLKGEGVVLHTTQSPKCTRPEASRNTNKNHRTPHTI